MKFNYFDKDLEYSLNNSDDDLFDSFYKRIFPNITKIEFCSDLETQKKGIDKIIYFKNGNKFTLDEKKRRRWYGDILLEIWSDNKIRKPGWLLKSTCDYIVYAVMPTRKIYLLPNILLKKAYITNKDKWLSYKPIFAHNPKYITESRAVPVNELLTAISIEMEQTI